MIALAGGRAAPLAGPGSRGRAGRPGRRGGGRRASWREPRSSAWCIAASGGDTRAGARRQNALGRARRSAWPGGELVQIVASRSLLVDVHLLGGRRRAARPLSARSNCASEVRPAGPFRLPRRDGMDGVLRRRGGVLERLLHHEGRAGAWCASRRPPRTRSCSARAAPHAGRPREYGIERMRFALGVDEDLRRLSPRASRDDPLIGRSLRARPWLRVRTPPGAVRGARVGDLRAADRVRARRRDPAPRGGSAGTALGRLGRSGALRDLRDLPTPARWPGRRRRCCSPSTSPARARGAGAGRTGGRPRARSTCTSADHERGWRRLRAIPGSARGPWRCWRCSGQGRNDQLPGGRRGAAQAGRAQRSAAATRGPAPQEREVRAFFAGLRRVGGSRRGAHAAAFERASAQSDSSSAVLPSPSPGRNSFVNGGRAVSSGLWRRRPWSNIQLPKAAHAEGSCQP